MTKIYVGNLAKMTTNEDLQQAFSQHGKVSEVSIVMDRATGQSRGFAFVDMPDAAEAATAIKELNSLEIKGRSITVNEARSKAERPKSDRPRPGGGRGRRW
jgi:RNA recognition motif-containing protein